MKKLQIKTLADRTGGIIEPEYQDWGDGGLGGGGCTRRDCTTTCLFRVECCCFYDCPSGGTWVCKGGYCPETSMSCL